MLTEGQMNFLEDLREKILTKTRFDMLYEITGGNNTQTKLSKVLPYSYNTIYKNRLALLKANLIECSRSGRSVLLKPTRKGSRLLDLLLEARRLKEREL